MSTETTTLPTSHEDPPEPKPAPLLRQVAIGSVLVAAAIGLYLFLENRAEAAPAASTATTAERPPLPVSTLTVGPRDVPIENVFLGQTEPSEEVEVRARVTGHIVERGFEDGQTVTEGQMLFEIDPAPFQAALAEARAGLRSAEAQAARAQQQTERLTPLVERQQAAQDSLDTAKEQLAVGEALVETRRAMLERAELDLEYATIRAPFDGVASERTLDLGSFVSGPTTILTTVRQLDPVYVRFSVSESDFVRWQTQQANGEVNDLPVEDYVVSLLLPGGSTFPHTGHIEYVDVAVDPTTGTAVVRATVPNPDGALRAGQFVRAKVSGGKRLGAIVVPKDAVLQSPAGASVYVVDDTGTAQMRRIELGEWTTEGWVVRSGLGAGDTVITDQLMKLRPGTPVAPTGA